MQTRTELVRIAEEIHAIASRGTEPLRVAEIDQISALGDRLEVAVAIGMEEAVLEAWREANRAA